MYFLRSFGHFDSSVLWTLCSVYRPKDRGRSAGEANRPSRTCRVETTASRRRLSEAALGRRLRADDSRYGYGNSYRSADGSAAAERAGSVRVPDASAPRGHACSSASALQLLSPTLKRTPFLPDRRLLSHSSCPAFFISIFGGGPYRSAHAVLFPPQPRPSPNATSDCLSLTPGPTR